MYSLRTSRRCRRPVISIRSGTRGGRLWVPKTLSMSCDQAIFVDQATDTSVSSDAVLLKIDRFGQRFQRRGAVQGAVRAVLIVVGLVLAQDPPQMGRFQTRVQSRNSRRHPPIQRSAIAFMRGVCTLHSTVLIPVSARTASNAAVKFGPPVANHELHPVCLSAEVHQQIACLLRGPFPGRVQGNAED